MTAQHLTRLSCDKDGCNHMFPGAIGQEGATGDLRAEAEEFGWETMKGKHGRDVCPSCRVVEINAAMQRRLDDEFYDEGKGDAPVVGGTPQVQGELTDGEGDPKAAA